MKQVARFTPLFAILHTVAIVILCYTVFVVSIFSSPSALSAHLKQAGLFNDAALLVQAEIVDHFPQELKQRIILNALAVKLLEVVVTPQLIERAAEPALTIAAKIMEQPFTVQNSMLVIDTSGYKQQAATELASGTLPTEIVSIADRVIAAVPNELSLMNLSENPNKVITTVIQLRALYTHIDSANTIAWLVAIVTFILIVAFNLTNLHRIFRTVGMVYLTAGIVVVIVSLVAPPVITSQLPVSSANLSSLYLNQMVTHASEYFFNLTRTPAMVFLVVGAVLYLISHWKRAEKKMQKSVDEAIDAVEDKFDGHPHKKR